MAAKKQGTNPAQMTAFERLAKQSAEGYADAWVPKTVNESVAGTVTRQEVIGHASQWGSYPVITIAVNGDEDTKVSVHCYHQALRSNIETLVVGDMIAITYLGKKKNKAGTQEYENYGVALADKDGVQKSTRKTEYNQHNDPLSDDTRQPVVTGPGGAAPSGAEDDIPF